MKPLSLIRLSSNYNRISEHSGSHGAVTARVPHSSVSALLYYYESGRVVHLNVEYCFEELLRQQSYAIKNQLDHPKPPTRGFRTQNTQPYAGSLLHTITDVATLEALD